MQGTLLQRWGTYCRNHRNTVPSKDGDPASATKALQESFPMNTSVVSYYRDGNVGVIVTNNPPVNALGHIVRAGILAALEEAEADVAALAVVLTCAGRTFHAGADISEFGKPPQRPFLADVIHRLETCGKPTVAALHGTALGGGFEIAMGCHYRVAVLNAEVGLPEVSLGIIPGAGGTQRLPRLIGIAAALDVIIGGRRLNTHSALSLGAIDAVFNTRLPDAAITFAANLVASGQGPRRTSDQAVSDNDNAIAQARKRYSHRYRGFNAPFRAIDAVEKSLITLLPDGLIVERKLFEACNATVEARALQYVFFAQRQAAKIKDLPKDPSLDIGHTGVIGGGTMGRGIAMVFADANTPVTLLEVSAEARDTAVAEIKSRERTKTKRTRTVYARVDRRKREIYPVMS